MAASGNVQNPRMTVKNCWDLTTWDSTTWDSEKLIELVGTNKADEIKRSSIRCKTSQDKFLWEPTSTREITTRSTWDIVRGKGAGYASSVKMDLASSDSQKNLYRHVESLL